MSKTKHCECCSHPGGLKSDKGHIVCSVCYVVEEEHVTEGSIGDYSGKILVTTARCNGGICDKKRTLGHRARPFMGDKKT